MIDSGRPSTRDAPAAEPAFSLLERTFLHVPMIGPRREADLWRRGFTDWDRFRENHPRGAFRDHVALWLRPERALAKLARAHAWRLYPGLRARVLYLDIESTGLRGGMDEITCIGTYDGTRVRAYVPDEEDLRGFEEAVDAADLLVTYNGSCFDLPFLKAALPRVDFARPRHIDLRWPLRRMGLRGGLKGIEPQMGIFRDASLDGVDGYLAVLLWRAHRRGHPRALETLVRYCLEDVVNLEPLMIETFNRLASALEIDVPVLSSGPRPELGVRADEALVRDLTRGRLAAASAAASAYPGGARRTAGAPPHGSARSEPPSDPRSRSAPLVVPAPAPVRRVVPITDDWD